MSARSFDVIVMGATGYSGRLVSRELNRMGSSCRWAIAGRDKAKLEALKSELGLAVPTLVADGMDSDSLNKLCAQTTAVIACAGPFDRVGGNLIAACVRNKTHYCDITGETHFIRRMIDLHHEEAKKAGVCIVSCCGYDCVPSEVGNYVLHKLAEDSGKGPLDSVHGYFYATGSPSGGTCATIANKYEVDDKADRKLTSLNPDDAPKVKAGMTLNLSRNRLLGGFSGPYLMAPINERLVRRSNALEGRSASYQESTQGSFMHALSGFISAYAMDFLLPYRPIRNFLLRYVLPAQGTGPSDASIAKGSFKGTFVGENSNGLQLKLEFSVKREWYSFTGLSAAVCGLLLVEGAANGSLVGGVVTPSVAFGQDLVDRLRSQGVVIKQI